MSLLLYFWFKFKTDFCWIIHLSEFQYAMFDCINCFWSYFHDKQCSQVEINFVYFSENQQVIKGDITSNHHHHHHQQNDHHHHCRAMEIVHEGWLTKSPPEKRIWKAVRLFLYQYSLHLSFQLRISFLWSSLSSFTNSFNILFLWLNLILPS